MDKQHAPDKYERAARFYAEYPTGQYDDEAEHALRCHFDLLEALKDARELMGYAQERINCEDELARIDGAIAKALGQSDEELQT